MERTDDKSENEQMSHHPHKHMEKYGDHPDETKLKHRRDHQHMSHHQMMMRDFKKRFIISLVITLPILALSPLIQHFLGVEFVFTGSNYFLFLLASAVFFYGGWPFLNGFFNELKNRSPGMMTLIAVAISVAYFYSAAVVFGLGGKFFFWELATLIDIMLLGHWIEMKSVLGASNALEKLAQLMPDYAHLIKNGDVVDVALHELNKEDRVLIKPGEKIPSDGVIAKGSSYVNESMLTGESKPVEKKTDDKVIAGSINGDGSLEIIVEGIGKDTYLSKVINLVKAAQESKSKTQRFADRAAFWLTIISLTVGFSTLFSLFYLGQDFTFSIERAATVMVITCPHALGLAIPLVVAVSTSLSAKNGLLIRNRTAFENSRKISTVVFDKTGTLTEGKFGVNAIESFTKDFDKKQIIRIAGSLEQNSEHPIATGIMEKLKEYNVNPFKVMDFKAMKGKGVEGKVDGKNIMIVSPGYLKEHKMDVPSTSQKKLTGTVVYVVINHEVVGAIGLSDRIRDESFHAIKKLQNRGIKCWMLTGDNEKIAEQVSNQLGLDGYFAGVLPHEKQDKIKELQSKDEFVAMTGDGVNDAPALAQADVGIAIGSGTDVAAETADIILVNSNPSDVTSLILFGQATYKKMVQYLFWATGYNVIAIPLAAGVLFSRGIIISPPMGAVLMSLSTIIVAVNAKFLKVEKEDLKK